MSLIFFNIKSWFFYYFSIEMKDIIIFAAPLTTKSGTTPGTTDLRDLYTNSSTVFEFP